MSVRNLLLGGLAILVVAGVVHAQDDDNGQPRVSPPDGLVTSGVLTYGTAATFPPFEYKKGGKLTGFDIEMIRILAGYMGLETEALDTNFDGLIPALQGNRIDVINSAMYIKPKRAKEVDFNRYMIIGESIVVPKGNGDNINELPDDLSGKDVAVTRGAIGEVYMKDFNKQLKEKGMETMNIMTFPTNQDALLAVRSGRAHAFDTSIPGAAYLNEKRPGEYEVATTFDLGTEIGIATQKNDDDMQSALQKALQIFVESGEYERLLDKYNFPEEVNYFDQ